MSKRLVEFTTHRAVTTCLGLALGLMACKGDDAPSTDEVGTTDTADTTATDTNTTAESSSSGMDTSTNDTVDTTADTNPTTDTTATDTGTDTTTDTSGPECGNGVIEAGEACDGGDVGGATCQSEGFASGNLSCAADCTLDTSTCSNCGDGLVNDAEECDGADLGMFATCADVMLGTANEPLACNADCTYDFGMCSGCGDGTIVAPEDCEGADLNGQDCVSQGFTEGTLACTEGCTFDTAGCALCGDAIKNGSEACDGADFGGLGCGDFQSQNMMPFDTGSLTCDGACGIDTSNCSLCGDGVISGNEICEPNDLAGETCSSQGFTEGVLACNNTCTGYDTSMCTTCGDGSVEGNEQCDGADLAGESCIGLGHPGGGTLSCSNTCLFDTSQCIDEFCGDGIANLNDSCDCGNQGVNCTAAQLNNQTCQSQGFAGGTLQCNSPMNCMFDTSQCYSCGDGVINPGEQCEGNNLNGQSCQTQGFGGGTLSCSNTCQFNTSMCTTCGNGVVNPGEQCDGANLNGGTCASQGFNGGGTLSCSAGCQYVTSQCLNLTSVCANPNTVIPTSGAGTASNINVAAGGTVRDVNVSINANHTWVGDLEWRLTKGANVRLLIDNVTNGGGGCATDNMTVTLDDEAAGGAVQGVCNANPPGISGTRTPNQTLSIFDNASMIGTWTMQPTDTAAGDGGTFIQWCLNITWN